MTEALTETVDRLFPDLRSELEALVRIPSVSADGFDPSKVRASAEASADLLRRSGFSGVTLLEIDGAHPAVYGEIAGPPGAPTVLLYAHHDVQPPGPDDQWPISPAFEPREHEGRLYGRGTSDDKAGVITHAAMGQVFGDTPPVTIKAFFEGEEEIGSTHLLQFLEEHGERLAADVIVIADSANWRVGTPSITTSLRGLVAAIVRVDVLESGVHSGAFGGALPDALTILTRVLASLHDDDGRVAIPGLLTYESDPLDLTDDELREQAGALPGVETIGEGALTTRLWSGPAAAVLAIDAPPLSQAINQLVPTAAAKVSVRIAPGDEPDRAMQALVDHLSSQPAWGAQVTVTPHEQGEPFAVNTDDPRIEVFREAMRTAWGTEVIDMGMGGSIPFVAEFSATYPQAAILLVGSGDPTSAAHGPNESVHLGDLRNSILAQAIALAGLAEA